MYFAYATGFFRKRYEQIGKEQQEEGFFYRFFRKFNHIESKKTKELKSKKDGDLEMLVEIEDLEQINGGFLKTINLANVTTTNTAVHLVFLKPRI